MSDSRRPDVAVLGSGVAGLTIAWRLLRGGATVAVLSGPQPPASRVAAGMLAPMPEAGINPSLGHLATEGLRAYPAFLAELAEDTDIDPGFRRSGLLRVAYDDDEAIAIRDQVGSYEAAGMPSRWLDPQACLAAAPGLGDRGLRGGLFSYEEAQVQSDRMLAALRDAVERRGGAFVEAEVVAVAAGDGDVTVSLRSVEGDQDLSAGKVVVAMGCWSGTLPAMVLPVRPVKGQLLAFEGVSGPTPIVYWGHHYLVSKADGSVVLGATMEDAGFSVDTDDAADQLRGVLGQLWPALSDAPATARAGLRPAAPDGLPVVGWLEPGAVYAFTGHFRNGFLLAPLTSKLAANEVAGDATEDLLRPLRPGRLSAPEKVG